MADNVPSKEVLKVIAVAAGALASGAIFSWSLWPTEPVEGVGATRVHLGKANRNWKTNKKMALAGGWSLASAIASSAGVLSVADARLSVLLQICAGVSFATTGFATGARVTFDAMASRED